MVGGDPKHPMVILYKNLWVWLPVRTGNEGRMQLCNFQLPLARALLGPLRAHFKTLLMDNMFC